MSSVVSAEIASKSSIAAIGGGPWCKMQQRCFSPLK